MWAYENGIIKKAKKLSPDKTMTRSDAVVYLWRLAGSPSPSLTLAFSDVSTKSSYAKAAAWAKENGIVEGKKLKPKKKLTLKAARAMLMRMEPGLSSKEVKKLTGQKKCTKAVFLKALYKQ